MSPKAPKSTSADEGTLLQQVVKRGLVGLSSAIIILSCTALLMFEKVTDVYQNKVHVLAQQENLIHDMRIAARERTILLYSMATKTDSFFHDEKRMAFYSAGKDFALAQIEFNTFKLSDIERNLIKKQNAFINKIIPLQEEVIEHVIEGKNTLAIELIREKAVPEQNKLLETLEELHAHIEKKHQIISKEAKSISNISISILISIVIIIIAGSIYIISQTTYRAKNLISQLTQTRKMLQTTIHELIQQKDTLDHHAIVSIADKQGNITYINDKFCEISGYERHELIGTNHRLLKSGKHPDGFYHDIWATISQGKMWQGTICNKRKDNSYYWVESTIQPFLDTKGIPYQYVSVRTDITHLLEAKNEAEKANRAKSVFLASMSHELRTPMNAIIGFSQLIELTATDESTKQSIKEISNAGDHLLTLINEILDISLIESGKVELFVQQYSLKSIIESCLRMIKPAADKLSIQIENKTDSRADINIHVDEKRFKQVLLNLLSNAVKYNKENGSVTIDYSVNETETLCLSVSDTGKGIASDQHDNIFNPFDRAGEEGSAITGSGLGLSISKNLIEKMNGSIGFESREGEGSRFWIEVPLS